MSCQRFVPTASPFGLPGVHRFHSHRHAPGFDLVASGQPNKYIKWIQMASLQSRSKLKLASKPQQKYVLQHETS
jgi:hypothetical protein